MNTSKYVFYLIYFVFHVFLLGGSIYMMNKITNSKFEWINGFINGDNWLFNKTNVIVFSVIGLVLFLISVIIINVQTNSNTKKVTKLESEVNSLKAKLYDLQGIDSPASRPVKEQRPDKSKGTGAEQDTIQ